MPLNRLLRVCALAFFVAGCGGSDNPAGPSSTGSGSGGTGSGGGGGGSLPNKTMTVTIDGAPFTPNFVTAARSNPGFEIVTVVGTMTNGTTVGFTAPTRVGVFDVNGPVTSQALATMTLVSGGTTTGYIATITVGSGTMTITSINATSVAGRVDLVMVPTTPPGANKTVSGTFDVAF